VGVTVRAFNFNGLNTFLDVFIRDRNVLNKVASIHKIHLQYFKKTTRVIIIRIKCSPSKAVSRLLYFGHHFHQLMNTWEGPNVAFVSVTAIQGRGQHNVKLLLLIDRRHAAPPRRVRLPLNWSD